MLERDKILLSTQAHFFFFYSATASGTCLSTNGISSESLKYRMITLPHARPSKLPALGSRAVFIVIPWSCCPWIWTLKFELYFYVRGPHLINIFCYYDYESRHLSSQTSKRLQYDTGEPRLFLLMRLSSAASTNCHSENSVWKLNAGHFQTKSWIIYIFSLIFSACWTKCVLNRLVPLKS